MIRKFDMLNEEISSFDITRWERELIPLFIKEKGMEEDQTWNHHFCDGIFQCNTICGIWKKY